MTDKENFYGIVIMQGTRLLIELVTIFQMTNIEIHGMIFGLRIEKIM